MVRKMATNSKTRSFAEIAKKKSKPLVALHTHMLDFDDDNNVETAMISMAIPKTSQNKVDH
jgi:hypothetical protein